jgi:hypothetical protein
LRKLVLPIDLEVIAGVANVGMNIKDGFQYHVASEFIFYEIMVFGASLALDFDLVCGFCVGNSL